MKAVSKVLYIVLISPTGCSDVRGHWISYYKTQGKSAWAFTGCWKKKQYECDNIAGVSDHKHKVKNFSVKPGAKNQWSYLTCKLLL